LSKDVLLDGWTLWCFSFKKPHYMYVFELLLYQWDPCGNCKHGHDRTKIVFQMGSVCSLCSSPHLIWWPTLVFLLLLLKVEYVQLLLVNWIVAFACKIFDILSMQEHDNNGVSLLIAYFCRIFLFILYLCEL
jgi:hypothetical protein